MEPENKNPREIYRSPAYGSSLELQPLIQSSDTTEPVVAPQYNGPKLGILKFDRSALYITGIILLLVLLLGLVGVGIVALTGRGGDNSSSSGSGTDKYAISSVQVNDQKTYEELKSGEMNKLAVNGELKVNRAFILTPTSVPQKPVTGQIYFDKTTNQPYYYNGKQFVALGPASLPAFVNSLGGSTGAIGLGNGLVISGNQLSLSASVLQAVAGAGSINGPRVTSFQGLTGDVTLAAGSGIAISGTTISNTGVTGLSGTANQISVSAGTGNIVLSLPQDIATTSTPTFGGATLNGALNVTVGGATIQGATGLTLGTAGSANGSLLLANTSNANYTVLRGLAPAGSNQVITIPDSGLASDTVCLLNLGNCSGGGSGVTSSGGTQNYIPKFTNAGATQIGNSLLYDNGVSVGVGTNLPNASYILDVNGSVRTNGNFSQTGSGTFGTGTGAVSLNGATTITGANSFTSGTGAVTLNGATSITGTNTLTVGTGASIFGGTVDVTGLTTLTGGATVTGAVNINTTGTANTNIGNATGTFSLVSSGLNISTAGALSGVTGYTQTSGNFSQSGGGTFGTGSGAVSLNGNTTITGTKTLTVGTGATTLGGTLGVTGLSTLSGGATIVGTTTLSSLGAGVIHADGSGVLSSSAVVLGTDTSGNYVMNLGALTGLTTSGNSGAGSTPTLSVTYGSGANTAVQGNVSLTCASGTGNLSGGGNSITLGSGGSCNNLTITNSPTFSGDLVVQGSGGITIGVPGSVTGNLNLANSTSARQVILQGLNPTGTGNATIQFPSIAGGATDTVCLYTLANCTGVGGGITGGGTNGKIARFTGAGSIGDSTLSESGSTVTASGNVAIQGANSLTLGTASTNTGSIDFYNSTNGNIVTLQAGASGSNFSLTLPTAAGSNGDCLQTTGGGVLVFAACTGGAGGGVTSLDSQTGVLTLANSSGSAGTITIDNASTSQKGIAQFNSTNFTASSGTINTIQNIDTLASPTFGGLTISGTTTLSALNSVGVVHTNGSGVLSTSAVVLGTDTSGDYVQSLGSLTGLSTTGNSGAGSTPTLSVLYGSTASTAVQGNVSLTCASGTGNLSGGGNSITLGSGGSCNNLTITNSPTFSGTLTVQGAAGITVGVAGSVDGLLKLANSTNSNLSAIQALAPSGSGTATYQLPSIAGGSSDTICLSSLNNCTAAGAAGGDLTGSYPSPTIAKLQGTTLTISSIASGDVLQYNGSAIVNGKITNSNLQAGTFSSITGTGALSAGSIASGFGTISTTNTIQGTTLNGTTGINTGAAGGTQRIDSSGNLVNIGTITTSGAINTATISGGTLSGGTFSGGSVSGSALTSSSLTFSAASAASVQAASGQDISLDAGTTGAVSIGGTSTGNILLGGGSGSTGCTVTNSTGAFACSNNITTTATIQGGIVNATSTLQLGGVDINTAGTLSNVAYLNGTGPQTFTGNNKFTGTFLAQNASNSTAAFQIQNSAGTSNLFVADTTNTRIGIATSSPGYTLDVNGTTHTTTALVDTNIGLQSAGGSASSGYITHGFPVVSGGINDHTAVIINSSGQAAYATTARDERVYGVSESAVVSGIVQVVIEGNFQVYADSGAVAIGDQLVTSNSAFGYVTVDNNATSGIIGRALSSKSAGSPGLVSAYIRPVGGHNTPKFQGPSDSTTAFQIQNAAGTSNLLVADTTNTRIAIGQATANYTLDVNGDINVTSGNKYRINGVDINTAGTLTNVAYQNQANTFTSAQTIQAANSLTLGLTGTNTGSILFKGSTGASGTLTVIAPNNPSNNTLTLPNETGTICSTGSVCTGYAPSTGGSGYIQNGTSTQTANFNIQSAAAGSVGGIIQAAASQTADLLQLVGTSTSTTFDNRGNLSLNNSQSANQDGFIALNPGGGYAGAYLQSYYNNSFFFKNAVAANAGGTGIKYVTNGAASAIDLDDGGGLSFNVAPSGSAGADVTLSAVFSVGNTGAANFRNTSDSATALQVQNAAGNSVLTVDTSGGQVVLGKASNLTGKIAFQGSGSANTLTLQGPTSPSTNTLTLPNETGTICSTGSVCTGYAPSTGGTGYIQNQNAGQQASSNFWISGTGRADTALQAPLLDTATAVALDIGTTNATAINLNQNTTLLAGKTLTVNGDAFSDLTGSGLVLSGGALTVDDSTATGFFRNGGNTFGAAATLGTNDSNVLNLETNNINRFQLSASASTLTGQGSTTLTSTGSLALTSAAAASLNISSGSGGATNINSGGQVSLTSANGYSVDISSGTNGTVSLDSGTTGAISIGTNANAKTITIGNVTGATSVGIQGGTGGISIGDGGIANTLQIGNTTGAVTQTINIGNNSTASSTSNINIGSSIAGTTAIQGATTITGLTSGSGDTLTVSNSTSTGKIAVFKDNTTSVFTLSDGGGALFKNSTNSTAAFQIQPSGSTAGLFTADTTNMRVSVGSIGTATGQLYVSGYVPSASVGNVNIASATMNGLVAKGGYIYTIDYAANTFNIIDASNPPTLVSLGSVSGPSGSMYGLAVAGRYAYTTDPGEGRIIVLDISNPTNPTVVGNKVVATDITQTYESTSESIAVQGRYAYVVSPTDGTIVAIDITNPTNPTIAGTVSYTSSGSNSLEVQGAYLYVLDSSNNNLKTFNISNPASMSSVGTLSLSGTVPISMSVSGGYAYIINIGTSSGLKIYNVSNPASMSSSGTVSVGSNPLAVKVQDRYAYVGMLSAGIKVVDISNPSSPALISGSSTGVVTDLSIQGRYAYMVGGNDYVYVYDLGGAYVQQLETGGVAATTLNTSGDVSVGGTLAIQGGFSVADSSLFGSIGVSGKASFQNATDSTSAFMVQRADGKAILGVDTTNSRLFTALPDSASAVGFTLNTNNAYTTSGAKLLSVKNSGTEKFSIDKDGNVDIDSAATYMIGGASICTSSGCIVDPTSGILNQTTNQSNANFNIQSAGDASITAVLQARASQAADVLQVQNSSAVKLSGINPDGSLTANAQATGTTATTSGTGTNTITVTLTGSAFANGDVIFIDNAGQDYYTRITAGGGTASLTVSPAVTFETGRTVTKYTIQNIGATTSDYTTQSNRFFQGYFLGGVVTGAGSTTLSDSRLASTTAMNFNSPSYTFQNTSDSATAFQIQNAASSSLISVGTTTPNLIANPSFESGTTGWTNYGAETLSQYSGTNPSPYLGDSSLDIATTTGVDGVKYSVSLSPSTSYFLNFEALTDVDITGGNFVVGFNDGSGEVDCSTANITNSWLHEGCIFNTGVSVSSPYIYIKQTDGTARNIWIDNVQLIDTSLYTALDYSLGQLQLNGIITSPAIFRNRDNDSLAFQVQDRLGNQLLKVDTINGRVGLANDTLTVDPSLALLNTSLIVRDTSGYQGLNVDTSNKTIQLSAGWGGDLRASSIGGGTSGSEPASVVANGYIYVLGGSNGTVQYASLNADGSNNGWATTTNFPTSSSQQQSAVVYNGYIYVIGSNAGSSAYYARINGDGTLGTWQSTNAPAGGVHNFSAVVYNGYIYVAAGGSANVLYAKINANGSLSTWTVTSMTTGAGRPQLVVVNDKLYLFQGSFTNDVYYATISSSGGLSGVTAAPSLNMSTPYKTRAVVMNGYIYAFSDDTSNRDLEYAQIPSNGIIAGWTTSTNYTNNIGYLNAIVAYNGFVYANGDNKYTINRTTLSGALDLVGISTQGYTNGGSSGAGASLTAGNTNIVGTLGVLGQTSLSQLSVGSDLNVAGQATFQNGTNSTSAFQVQNSSGNSLLSIDTATTPNLITNPSFELNTDGWAARSSATLSRITTQKYIGGASLQVVTGAASNNGVKYAYSLASSTTYSFSFYAKASTSTFGSMQVGRTDNGTTGGETNCLTAQVATTSNWTRFTCTFTTGTTSGSPYVYIKQSDAAAHTFYIDGVQLEAAAAATNMSLGNVSLDGIVNSHVIVQNGTDATNSFQIQNAAGTSTLFNVDTSNLQLALARSVLSGNLLPTSVATTNATSLATSSVDTTNSVGQYGSIAIGTDGLPIISANDATNGDLRVTKCNNTSCSSSSNSVDVAGSVGQYTSIAIGADGLPVISSYDSGAGDLKVTKCSTLNCASGITNTSVDTTNNVGQYTSIAIGTDGLPVISYYDVTNLDLRVTKCGNASCSSGNTSTTVDSTGSVGQYTSIAIGTDGLPVVSYYDSTNGDLKVTKCGNASCSSGNTSTTVDSTNTVGLHTSIAIGTDGLPVVSYYDSTNGDLRVTKCGNASCSSGNTTTAVDTTNSVGAYTSIAIGYDGLPVISYSDNTNSDLRVTKCGNTACSSGNTSTTLDSTGSVGQYTSIKIGNDGLPVISYYDLTNLDLKVTKCGNAACSGSGSTLSGGIELGSTNTAFQNAYINRIATADAVNPFTIATNGINRLTIDGSGNTALKADSTTAFQVQNTAGVTVLGVDTTNSKLFSGIADGASSVGFTLNTSNAYATSGAKLLSVQNNGSEKFSIDKDGNVNIGSAAAYKINNTSICTSSGCIVDPTSGIKNQTTNQTNANFNIQSAADASITAALQARASQTADVLQVQNSSGTKLSGINPDGSLTANAVATATTATTSGTGSNTTTLTFTGTTSFANGDVIFIDNAGQDYYTRITAGGNAASVTVSPAVSFDNAVTVTKYTVQNIGATTTDYTTQSNRFFQGNFLGDVTVGAGSTTLSDGRLTSTTNMNFNSTGYNFQNTSNSSTAFQLQNAGGDSLLNIDTTTFNVVTNPSVETNLTGYSAKTNFLSNSDFESTVTPWVHLGSTDTATRTTSQANTNSASMQVSTQAADGANTDGAKTTVTLASNTTYTLSFYAKASGSNFSTFEIGRTENGSTRTSCLTAQTVTTSGWTQFSCTFTTGTVSGTNYVYAMQTDAATRTFYLDTILFGSSATVSRTTLQHYSGNAAVQVDTAAVANDGVQYSASLSSSTKYALSFFATAKTASFSTLKMGFSGTGLAGDSDCVSSGQTVNVNGWTRYTCTFTTGTVSGTPYIYIRQTDATARTFYVDGLQLETLTQVITNGDFETNTSGWTHKGATDSVSRTTSQFSSGVASLQIDTTSGDAAGTDGAVTSGYSLAPNTTYSLFMSAKAGTTFSTFEMGYGTNGVDIPCIKNYTVTSSSFTVLSCNFTTGSTVTNSYIYAKQTDAVARTFYIDAVSLLPSAKTNFTLGKIALNGIINSPVVIQSDVNSTTAFQVQNASGASMLNVDTITNTVTVNGANSPETQSWATTTSLPSARVYHTVVTGNGYAYSLGGSTTSSGADDKVYYSKLLPNGGFSAWTTNSPSLPVNRSHHASVMANGYVYVIGGYDGSSVKSTAYYGRTNSDGSIASWNTTTSLPVNIEDATAFVYNGYVYVVSGYDGSSNIDAIYYSRLNSDGTLGSWRTTAYGQLGGGRRKAAVAVANGKIHMIGGLDSGATASTDCYSASINTDGSISGWVGANSCIPAPRVGASVAVVNNNIYLIGGTDGTTPQTSVYYASAPTAAGSSPAGWVLNANSLVSARDGFGAISANGYLYAVGGNSTTATNTNNYASLARLKVAGALDLVSLTSGTDTGNVSGGALVAGDTSIMGTLNVRGQTNFGQWISIGDGINAQGSALFKNSNNVSTAFQIQNAGGAQMFGVDAVNTNLVTNSDFEGNTTGWAAKAGASIGNSGYGYTGSDGLSITSNSTGDGATYGYKFLPNTQYYLSFYATVSAGDSLASIGIQAGYSNDGSTDTSCTSTTIATGADYTNIKCSFTTGSSISGSPYIYIKSTSASTSPPDTLLIDNVSLTSATITTSTITFNGVNTGELGTWGTTTSLASARQKQSSVIVNGYMYVIGGSTSTAVRYAKVNADGTLGAWSTSSTYDLPNARQEAVVVAANGYIYVIGGYDGSAAVKTVYYARVNSDGTLGSWRTDSPDIPAVRSDAAGFVANGYVYVTGGADNTPTVQSTIYYAKLNANGTTGAWQTNSGGIGGVSATRALHTAVAANGYAYFIGGIDGATTAQTTVGYGKLNADGTITNWGTGTALPNARDRHTSIVANGYLYVIGGEVTYNGTKQKDIYYVPLNNDGSIGNWITSGNPLPTTLMDHSSVVNNGYVYSLGGNNGSTIATVYYSSLARLRVGGSLDLVGLSGGNLAADGQSGTGGELTAGNTNIVGFLQVAGSANFVQNVSIGGELNVGGALNLDTGTLTSKVADSGSAVGFTLNTVNTLSTAGAKVLSVLNNGTEVFSIDKAGHIVTFGHIKSTQTTAPTIGTPTNCGGGTGPSATVTANSTDTAGSFTITAGSTGSPTTCDTVITFNTAYGSAPKSIIITPSTATGGNKMIYVSGSSTTTFTVKFGTGATNPANSEANTFNYWVIE